MNLRVHARKAKLSGIPQISGLQDFGRAKLAGIIEIIPDFA
jgi:hypothetical protein